MQDGIKFKDYGKHYSEDSFFKKIMSYAKAAGLRIVYTCLLLYYALQNPEMPAKTRAMIMGALGYFILPVDLIPDITPVVGYGDDGAVLMAAVLAAAVYIDEDVRNKAKKKLKDIFGDYDEKEIKDVDRKIDN